MKQVLTFEATPERPGGGLLLQLAIVLRQLNINPESLVWAAEPSNGALKISLMLREEDQHWLRDIADQMRRSTGMRDVLCAVADELPRPLPKKSCPIRTNPSWTEQEPDRFPSTNG